VLGQLRDLDGEEWLQQALQQLEDSRLTLPQLTALIYQLVQFVTVSR
jgi:hypothetical protein